MSDGGSPASSQDQPAVAQKQPGRHGLGGKSSEALGRAWTVDRKGLG